MSSVYTDMLNLKEQIVKYRTTLSFAIGTLNSGSREANDTRGPYRTIRGVVGVVMKGDFDHPYLRKI
jgi:hypothetical protein